MVVPGIVACHMSRRIIQGTSVKHMSLRYRRDLLPGPDNHIPLGSRFPDRWYPLEPKRPFHYIKKASSRELEIIYQRCGKLAEELGMSYYRYIRRCSHENTRLNHRGRWLYRSPFG